MTRETKQSQKNLTITSCKKIVTSLPFFRFMTNLKQCGSRIPNAKSVKVIFSLTVTSYLTKTENITKKPLTQLSLTLLLWVKVLLMPENAYFLQNLVLKGIFSETRRGVSIEYSILRDTTCYIRVRTVNVVEFSPFFLYIR